MIEWIIMLVIWIILTEVIFFIFAKDNYEFGNSFIEKKTFSILFSFIITSLSVGFPTLFAFVPRENGLAPFGPIAYAWYYGIIFAFLAFLGINYLIYKFINRKENA